MESFDILGSEQAGFRKGHSTIYHIFVLYALFEIYVKKRKSNLYCGFVDYSKAIDTIPRVHFKYGPSCYHKILMAKFLMSSEICILLLNPLLEAIM